MSALTLIVSALAYNDVQSKSNPRRKPIEWSRPYANLPVENANTESVPVIPGESVVVVDGTRTLGSNDSTAYDLALSALEPIRYRITYDTGTGTAPAFRADRAVDVSTVAITVTVNANQTATFAAGTGTPFTAVQVTDIVFIPGVMTGDPQALFDPLNQGFWVVLTATGNSLTLARLYGCAFESLAEVVTPTDDTYLQAWSAAGVQVGDTVDLSAGFAPSALHDYDIVAVGSEWIEFRSTCPLGSQTEVVPGVAGLTIYSKAKRLLFIETDQEIALQINGATDTLNRVSPFIAGEHGIPGVYVKTGPVWKLVIVNRAGVTANAVVCSAE